MNRVSNLGPRKTGLLVGALTVAVVSLTLTWSQFGFGESHYVAQFAEAAGLKTGDEVQVAGVTVGTVQGIRLAGEHVDVDFTVEQGVHLGETTKAGVKLATLLGTTYLDVQPSGSDSLSGDLIPLRNTFVTFQIQDLISSGTHSIQNLDATKLSDALSAAAGALPNNAADVGLTLTGLSRLAGVVNSRDAELSQLLSSANAVATMLQSHGKDVVHLMNQSDVLLQAILVRKQAVEELLMHLKSVASNLAGMLHENQATVGSLLQRVLVVTTMLKQRDAALAGGLRVLGATSRYLTNATGNGPFIDLGFPYPVPDNFLCASHVVTGCQ